MAKEMGISQPLQAQLADHQLERLESLLDDPSLPDAMRLDEIQGYLCAALAGPQPKAETEWLADTLGGEDVQESAAGREAAALLRAFATSLEAELAAGEPPVLLLYPRHGDESGPSDYRPWCQAYLAGVDAAEGDWFDFFGDGDGSDSAESISQEISFLDDRLLPLMVLTGEAEAAALESGEEWPQGDERAQIEAQCEEDLPQAVTNIYRFWMSKR